jgi:hypothetical protein
MVECGCRRGQTRTDPALRFQEAILVVVGLCADGHTNARGVPSPLLGTLLATRYKDEVRLRKPPAIVQQILLPLTRHARSLARQGTYD